MNFVVDLTVILISIGVISVIFRALKLPTILGYIVAGFLIGPSLGLIPLTSMEGACQWSEISIIFLLFALGLEFSFKKLLKVGSSALITAGVKFLGMMILGLVVGKAMGWTSMESIFLGGVLSMSSATIISKTYDDMGLTDKSHSPLLHGTLVFEDFMAVLLMILLSTLATSNNFAGGKLLEVTKLCLYFIAWFLIGIYLIPTLLKWARKYLTDEILLLTAIGLCFLMVALAKWAGFSAALGAFLMGSVLSETVEGERIEKAIISIKGLFGAVFFVTAGMLVNPVAIEQHLGAILVITLVALFGIIFFSATGAILAGEGLKKALSTGFSLAQLGEFAIIIAAIGCNVGVMHEFIYPVIVSVAVITTFTTPYMIKAADPAYGFLLKHLPQKFLLRISPAQEVERQISTAERNEWKKLCKNYLVRFAIYGILIVTVLCVCRYAYYNYADKVFANIVEPIRAWIGVAITLLLMMPFLLGLCAESRSAKESKIFLLKERRFNRWALMSLSIIQIMLVIVAVISPCLFFFTESHSAIFLIAIPATIILTIWSRHSVNNFTKMEERFFSNFNEKEEQEKSENPISTLINEYFSDKELLVSETIIKPEFPYIGKTLREMPFRHTVDINVIKIIRGSINIPIPSGSTPIYPYDLLVVVGNSEQLNQFHNIMGDAMKVEDENRKDKDAIIVDQIVLQKDSYMTNKTLRQISMKAAGCMIVGIMRDQHFISNPRADFKLLTDDRVWVAGNKENVAFYLK